MVAERLVPTLPEDTCIIVRLHPFSRADDKDFFAGMDRVHTFVPGRSDLYVERVMSAEDENHLAAQLQFSECIVSMASTITIDALSLRRPIINVAFEPDGHGDAICKFYDFNHFADLVRIAKPPLARDVAQVLAFVKRCLDGDKDPAIDSAAFAEYYVPAFSRHYPEILRATVEDVLAKERS
jgi:CDP-glycerol glycerophosphotransferase (TagB/SpsB family)